jgi:hypothetical protein
MGHSRRLGRTLVEHCSSLTADPAVMNIEVLQPTEEAIEDRTPGTAKELGQVCVTV